MRITEIERMISARMATLLMAWRQTLRALAVFPASPASFSEAAGAAVAQIDIHTLQAVAAAGFLERPEPTRYAIRKEVAGMASGSAPDEAACRRLIDHFARYAQAHAGELSVLNAEYQNLIRALELARSLAPAEFAGMMLNLGGLFEHRGDYGTWKELLIQAKGVAEPEGPDARLLLHLARVYEKLGDNPAAFDCARRGLEAASEDPRVVSPLLGVLGQIEINQGLLREAKRDLTRCLGYSERLNDTEARIQCFVGLGVAATRVGEYDEALRCTNEGIRLARATRNQAALASLLTNLGVLLYHQGRFSEAVRVDEEGLAIARQIGYSEKEAALLQAMGGALIRLGELDRAEECLRGGLEIARRIEHRWYVATILNGLGSLLQERGRLEEAQATFREAIEQSRPDSPDLQGYALFGLAAALAKAGKLEDARENATRSIAIFDQMEHHAAAEVRQWLQSVEGSGAS